MRNLELVLSIICCIKKSYFILLLVLCKVAWRTSTEPLTHNRLKPPTTSALLPQLQTTSVVPIPTTRSPYLTVNNITYATLQNPCEPTQAMCPIKCEMSNVSYHNRICETCYCSSEITKSFGKCYFMVRAYLFPEAWLCKYLFN